MVDSACRVLRDGAADGEQAPAVLVRDSLETIGGRPIFKHLLLSICENVSKTRSQAKGVVVVALSQSPEYYADLLSTCTSTSNSRVPWFQLLDCYSDPLGWEKLLSIGIGNEKRKEFCELDRMMPFVTCSTIFEDICNLEGLRDAIIQAGEASVDVKMKEQVVVVFDSMSVLLRHHSLQAVMKFLSILQSQEQVSAMLLLIHSDLHEPRYVATFEYFAKTVIHVEPMCAPQLLVDKRDQAIIVKNISEGRVRVRQKRRNGRVREQVEEFRISFSSVSFHSVQITAPSIAVKSSIPKVQFNIVLTQKEQEDRAKVVLPFEHQGNGKESNIYDGRANIQQALGELDLDRQSKLSCAIGTSGSGEVHYLRDSDDEQPDSDEDPDDDLDI